MTDYAQRKKIAQYSDRELWMCLTGIACDLKNPDEFTFTKDIVQRRIWIIEEAAKRLGGYGEKS